MICHEPFPSYYSLGLQSKVNINPYLTLCRAYAHTFAAPLSLMKTRLETIEKRCENGNENANLQKVRPPRRLF